jgi:hypothetical protein
LKAVWRTLLLIAVSGLVYLVPIGDSYPQTASLTVDEPIFVKLRQMNTNLNSPFSDHGIEVKFNITNSQGTEQHFVTIVQMTDADGYTVLLDYVEGTVQGGSEAHPTMVVSPMLEGYYLTDVFILNSIDKPQFITYYNYLSSDWNGKHLTALRINDNGRPSQNTTISSFQFQIDGICRGEIRDNNGGTDECLPSTKLEILQDLCRGARIFGIVEFYHYCSDPRIVSR